MQPTIDMRFFVVAECVNAQSAEIGEHLISQMTGSYVFDGGMNVAPAGVSVTTAKNTEDGIYEMIRRERATLYKENFEKEKLRYFLPTKQEMQQDLQEKEEEAAKVKKRREELEEELDKKLDRVADVVLDAYRRMDERVWLRKWLEVGEEILASYRPTEMDWE